MNIKLEAVAPGYLREKGIAIDQIDTHSLRSGEVNTLSLSGYSDRQIQKMGRWKEPTLKQYTREEVTGSLIEELQVCQHRMGCTQ